MTALLIGVGHPHRGDDGVGAEVARRAAALGLSDVVVLEIDDIASLIDTWAGADRVVVVDAMVSGNPPGTLRTLCVTDSPLPADGWSAGGTHALGLSAAVELSRALGRLPQRLTVVGIEISTVSAGAGLSRDVDSAVEPALKAVLDALEEGEP